MPKLICWFTNHAEKWVHFCKGGGGGGISMKEQKPDGEERQIDWSLQRQEAELKWKDSNGSRTRAEFDSPLPILLIRSIIVRIISLQKKPVFLLFLPVTKKPHNLWWVPIRSLQGCFKSHYHHLFGMLEPIFTATFIVFNVYGGGTGRGGYSP